MYQLTTPQTRLAGKEARMTKESAFQITREILTWYFAVIIFWFTEIISRAFLRNYFLIKWMYTSYNLFFFISDYRFNSCIRILPPKTEGYQHICVVKHCKCSLAIAETTVYKKQDISKVQHNAKNYHANRRFAYDHRS